MVISLCPGCLDMRAAYLLFMYTVPGCKYKRACIPPFACTRILSVLYWFSDIDRELHVYRLAERFTGA